MIRERVTGAGVALLGLLIFTVLIPWGIDQPGNVEHTALAPDFWPQIIAVIMMVLGVLQAIRPAPDDEDEDGGENSGRWLHRLPGLAVALGGLFGFYALIPSLGMVVPGAALIFGLMVFGGERRWGLAATVAAGVPFAALRLLRARRGHPDPPRRLRDPARLSRPVSEHLLEALSLFLTFQNVAILFLGVLIGAVVGAIPGMTTPMGVALALPFTFTMQPVTGILLLLGIYKGGLYGGSITAILIKAPGTPAASCTVLDGYPLTRKGEARKALDIALYASCFADFVSNLSLILLAGLLAGFALKFGPPEFFTLIVFSLTIIAGVSGRNLVKGMASAALGLLFATIGLDMVYGTNRFIFDNWNLMGGLSFIPVLIGLFALPEIIHYFAQKLSDVREATTVSGTGAGMADFRRCFKSILRGSLIGVVLGAIPGIGGAPSAFLSYSEAKRTSPNSRNFGKGELEGVAAAEAGNNGVAGATMIPLLALGVPGDVITAVILGAFMIHGLRPGPVMFVDNLPMIYALFIGIMLSSAYLFVIGKFSIRAISRISEVPNRILYPVVLVFCLFGSFAINHSMFDVLMMVLMGCVGYVMMLLRFPAPPFLIAFILGPLLEDNFRQSMILSEGGLGILVRSGICWFFWALTLLSLVLLVRSRKRNIPLSG